MCEPSKGMDLSETDNCSADASAWKGLAPGPTARWQGGSIHAPIQRTPDPQARAPILPILPMPPIRPFRFLLLLKSEVPNLQSRSSLPPFPHVPRSTFVLILAQRVKLKLRRSDMIVAQGKSRTAGSATLGKRAPKEFSLSPSRLTRRGSQRREHVPLAFERHRPGVAALYAARKPL